MRVAKLGYRNLSSSCGHRNTQSRRQNSDFLNQQSCSRPPALCTNLAALKLPCEHHLVRPTVRICGSTLRQGRLHARIRSHRSQNSRTANGRKRRVSSSHHLLKQIQSLHTRPVLPSSKMFVAFKLKVRVHTASSKAFWSIWSISMYFH